MTAAKFQVKRPFLLDGRIARPGEIVEVSDRHVIATLLNSGKVAPTRETESRLQSKPTLAWEEMTDDQRRQWQPALPGAMLRPMRN